MYVQCTQSFAGLCELNVFLKGSLPEMRTTTIYKSEAKKIREHNLFWYFTKFFE